MKLALCFALLTALPAMLAAQRPNSPAEALLAFEDVRNEKESRRHGAMRDMGRFDSPEITAAMLSQLEDARTSSYRRTVIRAIGAKQRDGVVEPLLAALRRFDQAPLCEAAAGALRRQGNDGLDALAAELPKVRDDWKRRNAICYAFALVERHDRSRDVLIAEIQKTLGRGRDTLVRGLARRSGDAKVDALRIQLAGDKAVLVAAEAVKQLAEHDHEQAPRLALQLARRLSETDRGLAHAAAVRGMIQQPSGKDHAVLWRSVALADAPFREPQPWTDALTVDAFFAAMVSTGLRGKDARSRAAATRALAHVGGEARDAALAELATCLQDRDDEVVRAACASAAALGAFEQLEASLGAGSASQQALRIATLMKLDAPLERRTAAVEKLGKKLSGEALAAWLRCCGDAELAKRPETAALAVARLGDRDASVRAAALDLVLVARSKQAVPALIARLKKEKGRLHQDTLEALRALTGAGFGDARQWAAWWKKEQASFELAANRAPSSERGKPDDTAAVYWQIPVTSERVAFVVDTSGSMRQPFGTGNGTRLDEAKRQLHLVFERLPKTAKANLVTFSYGADTMFGKLTSLGRSKRKAADAYVDALEAAGSTNVWIALHTALADPNVDTVFLLTDGRPSIGPIVDIAALADEVARWNAGRGVRIHTIALGGKSPLLEQLARDSGGEHTVAR